VMELLQEFAPDIPDLVITDDTDPISGLGLASADGIDFALDLEVRLGVKISPKVNPLVDDVRHRARTVREIVEFIKTVMAGERQEVAGA